MTARAEQETTVSAGRDESVVRIWTSNIVHLRQLRKDARFTEVSGGTDWGQFTVPADVFDALKGLRRKRNLTDEQRAAAGERLRAARSRR